MGLERTRVMWSAIIFLLLQGLISTQQTGLSSGSISERGGGGIGKEYNVAGGDIPLEESAISISSGGGGGGLGGHPPLISKREAPSITAEAKGGGEGGDASAKEAKKVEPSPNASGTATSTKPSVTTKGTVHKTLWIPDRSPANLTSAQMKEESESEEEEDTHSRGRPGKGDFDDKAVQRAIIVIGGIVLIIIAYLGVKFFLFRKANTVVDKRYGRIESSEMDLLEEVDEEEESEEEEELFDINQQRRS